MARVQILLKPNNFPIYEESIYNLLKMAMKPKATKGEFALSDFAELKIKF